MDPEDKRNYAAGESVEIQSAKQNLENESAKRTMDEQQCRLLRRLWGCANWLRFLIGCIALFSTFILIMSSDKSLDVFLNFLAVEFVCQLDNNMFVAIGNGFLGEDCRKDVKFIEDLKLDEAQYEHIYIYTNSVLYLRCRYSISIVLE